MSCLTIRGLALSGTCSPFVAPLNNVEFDKEECYQPEECIPEVEEVAIHTPVHSGHQ